MNLCILNKAKLNAMSINQTLLAELDQESKTTRKILERIPTEQLGYKPHEKSFTIGSLGAHVGELTSWVDLIINTDELDFAKMNYTPPTINTTADIMKIFEDNLAKAKDILQNATNEKFDGNWKLRNREQIYFDLSKTVVLRNMVFNHIVHHRAQLGVYLRLLNIAVPSSYGPTADYQFM